MKVAVFRIIQFCLLFLSLQLSSFAQSTLVDKIEHELDEMLRNDAKTWKMSSYDFNSLTVNDAEEINGGYTIEGTFICQYHNSFLGKKAINYKAEIKVVLDDVRPKKLWYIQPFTNVNRCIGNCF